MIACAMGNLDIVFTLLVHNKEVHVNARDAEGCTALIAACSRSDMEGIVSALLKHKEVDVNAQH